MEAEYAEAFLRAGGTISWSEWESLDPIIKAALVGAGNRLQVERILMAVRAGASDEGFAVVASAIDGGDLMVRMALSKAMNLAVQRAGK